MIAVGLTVFGALFFVLGVIVGSLAESNDRPRKRNNKTRKPSASRQLQNFLSYDGTEQK